MFKNIRNYFKQYCDSTSIHGFRYLGENRTIFEKVWWIGVFIVSLSGCGLMIYKIYEKYETSPVIVTFATKETPLYKIPFPAVTICPETKSIKKKFDYGTVMQNKFHNKTISNTANTNMQYMSLLCEKSGSDWETNSTFTGKIFDILDEFKPDFLALAYNCTFMNVQVPCEDIFIPIMTDEGVCYSFNILDRRQIFEDFVSHYHNYHEIPEDIGSWTMEKGYLVNKVPANYPRRALLVGAANGLTINLATPKRDLDYTCKDVQGFKVVIHSPIRIPKLKQEFFRIPLDQIVLTAVQPVMITTSNAVKSFDVNKRDCYFPLERKLQYFKSYSQQNCHLECLTNVTLAICKCVSLYMPSLVMERYNSTPICGSGNYSVCMREAERLSQYIELFFQFYDPSGEKADERFAKIGKKLVCNCLPLCTDISYHTEISQTDWDWRNKFESFNASTFNKSLIHLSSLTVYFKLNHFISSERRELYGPTDFVANFGGLLGLFTGFSILSLLEILYFLTIRICCNVRLYRRWTGIEP